MNTQPPPQGGPDERETYDPNFGFSAVYGHPSDNIPGFCKSVITADVVLASIRLMLLPLSVMGYNATPSSDPLKGSMVIEIGLFLLIGLNGVIAGAGMLMKQRWAVPAGWANVGATALGILLAVYQFSIVQKMPEMPDSAAFRAGSMCGFGFTLSIRIAVMVMVCLAIARYARWLRVYRR